VALEALVAVVEVAGQLEVQLLLLELAILVAVAVAVALMAHQNQVLLEAQASLF
jgi:hypothetical protein